MGRYIILRHYVSSRGSLDILSQGIQRIANAIEISKAEGYDINFGLKLTTNVEKMTPELHKVLLDRLKDFPYDKGCYLLYDPKDRGPGTSSQQIFVNPTFFVPPGDRGIVAGFDLDQIRIDGSSLEKIHSFMKVIEDGNFLYGIGSRDVPTKLAWFRSNSRLREIHELIHSLSVGVDKFRCPEVCEGASEGFAYCGESSGVSFFNTNHELFPILLSKMAKATYDGNFRHWASEYYIALTAATLSDVAKTYIPCYENPSKGDGRSEEWEREHIEEFIRRETAELAKTDLYPVLAKALDNQENVEILKRFYSEEEVLRVFELMKEGLSSVNASSEERAEPLCKNSSFTESLSSETV